MGKLFSVSDRKNFIHRCFRAAAAEEALTNILRTRAVRRCLQNGVDRGADGGGVGFFELEARAKFGDAIRQATGLDLAHHPILDALSDLPTRVQVVPARKEAIAAIVQTAVGA